MEQIIMQDSTKFRIYGAIPGALIWTTLLLSLVLSFFSPIIVICFIIAYDLYWLLRVVHFIFYASMSYLRYRKTASIDWLARVEALPNWQRIYHIIYLSTCGDKKRI